jgi:3-oxoadipate enol-lactonase
MLEGLYYESHGDGPAIVFVHGSGGNHLSWWRQVPTLARAFRCITFDLRGYGFSAAGEGQRSPIADVLALLDHLGIERTHLVGQSLGGRICLGFALAYPERVERMVLASTLAGIRDERIERALAAHGPPPHDLFERALAAEFRRSQTDLTFLYREIEAINRIDNTPPAMPTDGPSATDLAALRAATLLIGGAEDPVVRPDTVALAASLLPGARHEIVADAGHSAYFEQPDTFNRLVRDFLLQSTCKEKST